MPNSIDKLKSEVRTKWLPIFESWFSAPSSETNLSPNKWRKHGNRNVNKFKQIIERLVKILPQEEDRISARIREADRIVERVKSSVDRYEKALKEFENHKLFDESIIEDPRRSMQETKRWVEENEKLRARIGRPESLYQKNLIKLQSILIGTCRYIVSISKLQCSKCGKLVHPEDFFCRYCGAKLTDPN